MKAKEMFEALGYECSTKRTQIWYFNEETDKWLWFYLNDKTLETNFDVDMPLLKAINQQCKELGWLDE